MKKGWTQNMYIAMCDITSLLDVTASCLICTTNQLSAPPLVSQALNHQTRMRKTRTQHGHHHSVDNAKWQSKCNTVSRRRCPSGYCFVFLYFTISAAILGGRFIVGAERRPFCYLSFIGTVSGSREGGATVRRAGKKRAPSGPQMKFDFWPLKGIFNASFLGRIGDVWFLQKGRWRSTRWGGQEWKKYEMTLVTEM